MLNNDSMQRAIRYIADWPDWQTAVAATKKNDQTQCTSTQSEQVERATAIS